MNKIYESDIEQMTIETLESQGYIYLTPEKQEEERGGVSEVILKERLQTAIANLNPDIPRDAQEHALKQIINLPTQNLIENNEAFHRMLTEGVPVEYQKNGDTVGGSVQLVDWENPTANDLVVTNQFTVHQNHVIKRPDVSSY